MTFLISLYGNLTETIELSYETFQHQTDNMIKHTQAIRWKESTNCLSVLDHFVGLALKGLINLIRIP